MPYTIEPNEVRKFKKLYYRLVTFMNNQLQIVPGVTMSPNSASLTEALKMAYAFRENANPDMIESFLQKKGRTGGAAFSDWEQDVVRSWKNLKSGKFYVVACTYEGAIFISPNDFEAYLVSGLRVPIDEYVSSLPTVLETCLLGWDDTIITDGFVTEHKDVIDEAMRTKLSDIYDSAVRNDTIHRTL